MRNIFLLSPCGTCRAACVGVMPGIGRPVASDLRPGKRPCGQGRKNWKQRVPEPVKSKIHHRSGFAALDRISVVGFKGAIHDRIPVAGEGFSGKIPFSWMLRHAIRIKLTLSSSAKRQKARDVFRLMGFLHATAAVREKKRGRKTIAPSMNRREPRRGPEASG